MFRIRRGFFEVIADTIMSMEVTIFKELPSISLIVFSNVGSGSNFSTSKILLIQSGSKFSSKDLIDDGFVTAEAIIFRCFSLISLIVLSNFGSVSNFLLQSCCSY